MANGVQYMTVITYTNTLLQLDNVRSYYRTNSWQHAVDTFWEQDVEGCAYITVSDTNGETISTLNTVADIAKWADGLQYARSMVMGRGLSPEDAGFEIEVNGLVLAAVINPVLPKPRGYGMNRVEQRLIEENEAQRRMNEALNAESEYNIEQEEDGMIVIDDDDIEYAAEQQEGYYEYMSRMMKEEEVQRENNKDVAEYRVFNVSMREMQIQTLDLEEAFEVWREGEKATGERWTLLVMPPLNGKKLYLQDNAVHEYRTDKLMKDTTVYQDVGMATPDFHGDFSAMDKWTQEQIINPKHYKIVPAEAYSKHPEGLEYMDVMEYALSHLSGVEAHTMGHVFKYAFRIGKKDAKLQDAKKIAWYANRMVEILEYPEETLMSEDTIITTLDQEGKCKDVEVIIDAGSMFLRQWSEDMEDYGLIEMSNQQLKDIVAAI
jgi:hypothetical protein